MKEETAVPKQYTVRRADFADEAPLFALVRSFPTPTPPGQDAYIAALRRQLTDPSSFVAVAEHGGALIGYVAGYCHSTFHAAGWTAWVDEVFVEKPHRGRGVGRLLMAAFEAWAVSRQCKLLSLATAGAGPFYEGLGFVTRASYYKKYLPP